MRRKMKWSKARRAHFNATIEARRNHYDAKSHINVRSHFYRLKGTELIPVKVKKIVAWVIE
jgi:hypothetical protein